MSDIIHTHASDPLTSFRARRTRQANRFHAACREMASACPMVAQLNSRSRRMSATSRIAASILSNAPLYPARVFNKASVGALSGKSEFGTPRVAGFRFFWTTCRQSSTHSSQMNTPGPATRVLTSVCAFPQNEQRYARFEVCVVLGRDMLAPFVRLGMSVNHVLTHHVNHMLTAPTWVSPLLIPLTNVRFTPKSGHGQRGL